MSTPLLMVDPRGSAETSREKTEIHPRRVTNSLSLFFLLEECPQGSLPRFVLRFVLFEKRTGQGDSSLRICLSTSSNVVSSDVNDLSQINAKLFNEQNEEHFSVCVV